MLATSLTAPPQSLKLLAVRGQAGQSGWARTLTVDLLERTSTSARRRDPQNVAGTAKAREREGFADLRPKVDVGCDACARKLTSKTVGRTEDRILGATRFDKIENTGWPRVTGAHDFNLLARPT